MCFSNKNEYKCLGELVTDHKTESECCDNGIKQIKSRLICE